MMRLNKTGKSVLTGIAAVLLFTNIALAIPGMPHQFYGDVVINGNPSPDNILIDAKISNDVVSSAFTKDGKYGYEPIFYVLNPDGKRDGNLIEFYISNVKAGEYYFSSGASTRLDLSATIPNFCGDAICEAGESCSTCPGDCGQCSSSSSSSSSGGSGSSSSSGGSAPLATTTKTDDDETTTTTTGDNEQTNNQEEETKQTTCTENWKCSEWFDCFNSRQKRVCMDLNSCGTEENKPIISQECAMPLAEDDKKEKDNSGFLSSITGNFLNSVAGNASASGVGILILILILGIAGIIYAKKSAKISEEVVD
ncbi:MAG: hypothetical protein DRN66_03875 [Candidatus Nanohalarchaeota archaeon]|nr:MAG: hypothetical protein DRN66_03875 [Candidatus Nanohaloarchaeota archaeon]